MRGEMLRGRFGENNAIEVCIITLDFKLLFRVHVADRHHVTESRLFECIINKLSPIEVVVTFGVQSQQNHFLLSDHEGVRALKRAPGTNLREFERK